ATAPSHKSAAVGPNAVTAPTPVTTTRRGDWFCVDTTAPSVILLSGTAPHRDGDGLAGQATGQRDRVIERQGLRSLRDPVEVARWIGLLEVERRRHRAMVQCQGRHRSVECAGAADQVP